MKAPKASIPGIGDKAKNPRFIKGVPRLVVPKKLPKASPVETGPNTPVMQKADKVQANDLSNSGYHSSSFKPNRGSKPPKVSFGDF